MKFKVLHKVVCPIYDGTHSTLCMSKMLRCSKYYNLKLRLFNCVCSKSNLRIVALETRKEIEII